MLMEDYSLVELMDFEGEYKHKKSSRIINEAEKEKKPPARDDEEMKVEDIDDTWVDKSSKGKLGIF